MPNRNKVPFCNRSPSGWWLFREVELWVPKNSKMTPRGRYPVWENTRLLRAKNREDAFVKAMRLGRAGHPSKSKDGEWRFAGISMLLPIYEDIEDGAEILWVDRGSMSLANIRKLVKSRRQLPLFHDKGKT